MCVPCRAFRLIFGLTLLTQMLQGCLPPDEVLPPESVRLFELPYRFLTADEPFALAVADLNGDGKPDIASCNRGNGNVSVLLSATLTTYQPHVEYPAGQLPAGIVAADIDNDGDLDLLVCNAASNDVSVLRNGGNGTFTAAAPGLLLSSSAPAGLAAGDFNGDGAVDIVTANSGLNNVSILMGNGDGSFALPVTLGVGNFPRAVIAQDVDGDGTVDILTANRNSNDLTLLRGVGDGSFSAPLSLAVGEAPRSLAAGRINADAHVDLIASNPNSSDLSLLLGNGSGGFATQTRILLPFLPTRFVLEDLNRDGKLDLAVLLFSDGTAARALGVMAVLWGNGDGTFSEETLFGTGSESLDIAVLRSSPTAFPHLVVADNVADRVSLVLNAGNGNFVGDLRIPVGDRPREAVAVDLNNDANPDIAVSNLDSREISIIMNRGSRRYEVLAALRMGDTPRAMAAGDFNGDGKQDLAITNLTRHEVSVFLGRGNGSFEAERRFGLSETGTTPATARTPRSIALGDVNGDGKLDIATGNSDTDNLSVLLGKGDGSFEGALVTPTNNFPLAIHLADFDRDGKLDIISTIGADPTEPLNPRLVIMFGLGNGRFDPNRRDAFAAATNPAGMDLGDLNGDGNLDAVVLHPDNDRTVAYRGQPDGRQTQSFDLRAGTTPNAVLIAEVTGDTRQDIVTTNEVNTITVQQNRGNFLFLGPLSYAVGSRPIGVASADLDRDGSNDLILCNAESNDVSIVYGEPTKALHFPEKVVE